MKASTGAEGNEITAQAQLHKALLDSGLRGRGGAGFSADSSGASYATESQAGLSHLQRGRIRTGHVQGQIIYKDPHQLIEGMIIACWANP